MSRLAIVCSHTVRDFQDRDDLTLVTTDFEVEDIKRHLGNSPELEDFGAFLVKVEDGEYKEIYGIKSNIPWLDSTVCEIRI